MVFYVLGFELFFTYIPTYQLRVIPEGIAEASQIFIRDAYVLSK
jgi:hypothetical protein